MSLPTRFVKKSAVIINATPIYHKELGLIIYAADKLIVLYTRLKRESHKLQAHSDTVCALQFHPNDNLIFISAGLDGRIVEWSLPSGQKLRHYNLKLPIRYLFAPFVALEMKRRYVLRYYDEQWINHCDIFRSKTLTRFAIGGRESQLLAYIQEAKLFIYWMKFLTSVCYPLTTSTLNRSRKSFTCVAVHPTEFIVATANSFGEIFVWYNLVSATTQYGDQIPFGVMDDPEDSFEFDESVEMKASFGQLRQAVQTAESAGKMIDYYPVHPANVRRNLVHWHSTTVTTLAFTPTGSHLLSGGLEGVLVKWDMTECLGGPQHRRFLPHLGSPLVEVNCPGGPAEDTIVVTLEHNTYHILSGAFEPIETHVGFVEMPRHWLRHSANEVPTNLAILPKRKQQTWLQPVDNLILTNGAMGSLQLLDVSGSDMSVIKIDVTRQTVVPRDNDRKLPVSFSEVMLLSHTPTLSGFHWVVTYERVTTSQMDDEARLTWWKYLDTVPSDEKAHWPRLDPVQTISLSHLNCPVTDMDFVSTPELGFYIMLLDHRLFIYHLRSDPAYPADPQHWALLTSHLLGSEYIKWTPSARAFTTNFRLPRLAGTSPDTENHLFLKAAGSCATLYHWSDLIEKTFPIPIANLDLMSQNRPMITTSNANKLDPANYFASKPTEIFIDGVSPYEKYLVTCKSLRRLKNKPAKTSDLFLLCFIRLSLQNCHYHMELLFGDQEMPVRCVGVHPRRPQLCVSSTDGKAILLNVSVASGDRRIHLDPVRIFQNLPAHPLIDRKAYLNDKLSTKPTTNFVTLKFVHHSSLSNVDPTIVGLIETRTGRERGRRDLVVYGFSTLTCQPTKQLEQMHPPATCKENLLKSVTPRRQRSDHPTCRKRPAEVSDKQFENALRQISQYPLHTAPAPEQLLRQLMEVDDPT